MKTKNLNMKALFLKHLQIVYYYVYTNYLQTILYFISFCLPLDAYIVYYDSYSNSDPNANDVLSY